MIAEKNLVFSVSTENTSYVMAVLKTGHLVHLAYGRRIASVPDISCFLPVEMTPVGTLCYWDDENDDIFPDNLLLEYSAPYRGDNREASFIADAGNGRTAMDLLYKGYRIYKGKASSFPASIESADGCETLEIELEDSILGISVFLSYSVFPSSDVIVRSAAIRNGTSGKLSIKEAASLHLDIPRDDWTLFSYDGAWARERYEHKRRLEPGITIIDSKLGTSGNEHNPLIYLQNGKGEAYGFNLVYSGNHRELLEISPFGALRVITGINPYCFEWILESGESFATPEAIMTYSPDGVDGAAVLFNSFINRFVIPPFWRFRTRSVLLNSWEGCYFDFDEKRLLELAESGKELGVELFVLDDGWFGNRTDDTKGLGDWYCNRERFPDGLDAFAERIHALGLQFGIWMEPEMVNMDSELYRVHPDWVISLPDRTPLKARHQLTLDLSRNDVRDFIYQSVSSVIRLTHADYIKWDMNRSVSDVFSHGSELRSQGEVLHRYIIGLYEILGKLRNDFPEVLFEGCASGGSRYDLGMLLFMPQIWASDNTDLHDRVAIDEGTLRGYPLSTMGAHVSASPSHQSLRTSRIDSRFNIASFGVLGYELDVTKLSDDDRSAIRDQIVFYKKYRDVFQFGAFSSLHVSDNQRFWYTTLGDTSIALEIQTFGEVHTGRNDRLFLPFAADDKTYRITARREHIPSSCLGDLAKDCGQSMSEDFSITVPGAILKYYGLPLGPQFTAKGFTENTRILGDYGSRMYIIESI